MNLVTPLLYNLSITHTDSNGDIIKQRSELLLVVDQHDLNNAILLEKSEQLPEGESIQVEAIMMNVNYTPLFHEALSVGLPLV